MTTIIHIETEVRDSFDELLKKEALISLAKYITTENLRTLANLAKKPNINDKIPKLNNPMVQLML